MHAWCIFYHTFKNIQEKSLQHSWNTDFYIYLNKTWYHLVSFSIWMGQMLWQRSVSHNNNTCYRLQCFNKFTYVSMMLMIHPMKLSWSSGWQLQQKEWNSTHPWLNSYYDYDNHHWYFNFLSITCRTIHFLHDTS